MNVRSLEWVQGALSAADVLVSANAVGAAERTWLGAAIDSRAECASRLFFALRGERVDGHRFVSGAIAAGCVAAVVEDAAVADELTREEVPNFHVKDGRKALQELARAYRNELDVRVVAITGSAGKTTTKEFIRAILKQRFRVHSNVGNLNSLIGVPLTVLEAEAVNEYMISEVGANQPGEVGFLSELLRPDVGVITNIGDAHVGMFGSRDGVASAKSELFRHVPESGRAVLPRDDDYYQQLRKAVTCKTVTFGSNTDADFVVGDVAVTAEGTSFTVNGDRYRVDALGRYNAMNAAAACAVAYLAGVASEQVAAGLASVTQLAGRGKLIRRDDVTLIDESYNASPSSMMQSLSMLADVSANRHLAVLGDMGELGSYSDASHGTVGTHLAGLNVDTVVWVGENAGIVKASMAKARGKARFVECPDVACAIDAIAEIMTGGDVILVKASRACGLDEVVAWFETRETE